MKFNGFTKKGREYLAKVQANKLPILWSKVKFGDGLLTEGEDASELNDIKNFKIEKEILNIEQENDSVVLSTILDNISLQTGYFPRETGIYVDDGGQEILYWYMNDDLEVSWLPPESDGPAKLEIELILFASSVQSVVVNNTGKNLYIDKKFLDKKLDETVKDLVGTGSISKPVELKGKPFFEKSGNTGIKIKKGFSAAGANDNVKIDEDLVLNLPEDAIPGTDYYIALKDNKIIISKTKENLTVLGGFHYSLIPLDEEPTGNKTEEDMKAIRGINTYSFWDLTFKSASVNPEGKVLIANMFWRDIYPADDEITLRGFSSCKSLAGGVARIAGGAEAKGRKLPIIPKMFGGDGSIRYPQFSWFDATELARSLSCRHPHYDEYSCSSYGVVENQSLKTLGYTLATGEIKHYKELTSKWGVECASGVQWYRGIGFIYRSGEDKGWKRRENTFGRGNMYTENDSYPACQWFGGQEEHTAGSSMGSRALYLYGTLWNSIWSNGLSCFCDHLQLD